MESNHSENIISTWDKLCRICLIDQTILVPVYKLDALDEQYKISFCEMLDTCSNLKVSSNDNFPQLICSLCVTHMRHALEFKIKCQSSESLLKDLLHKRNDTIIKTELKEDVAETDTNYHEKGFVETDNKEKNLQKNKLRSIVPTNKKNVDSNNVKLEKLQYLPITSCPLCHESYTYRELAVHKGTHPNACWKCNIDFISVEEHKEHVKDHEENNCSECGKIFTSKRLCKQHEIIHAKDKCLCIICGKKFSTPSNLAAHHRKHTREQRYDCNYCGKKFINWSTRKFHIRNHHTLDKPFACDVCNSRFANKTHLDCHKLTHSNDKPFACSVCDSKFKQKSTLNMHMFKHTGNKRVFCKVCNKGFVKNYNLKVHMVTHTGEKNYSCSVCNKGFSQAHVLRTHMKTHSDNASIWKTH